MAETRLVSLRVPVELWEWAGVYAAKRSSTKTAIVEAALREFREAAEGGVPELEQASSGSHGFAAPPTDKSPRGSGGHSPRSAAPARASVDAPHVAGVSEMHPVARPAQSEWERTMRARQTRLNKGKG